MKTTSKFSYILTFIVIAVLFILISIIFFGASKYKEMASIYKVSVDSMITYRNEKGRFVAKCQVLQATNNKYLLSIQTKDSSIIELQNMVKEERKKRHIVEVALVIKDQTIFKMQDSIKNAIVSQTIIKKGDTTFIYPVYKRIIADPWINDTINLGLNYFKNSLIVRNNYQVVIGSERKGLFKVKPFAQITNLNPYSETKEIKVYQQKPAPNKPLKAGLIGGIGGFVLGIIAKTL